MMTYTINASRIFISGGITDESYTDISSQTLRQMVEIDADSREELILKFAPLRERLKAMRCITFSAAITSICSSVILFWMIRRSHVGITSTYHRLLLGLCIGDIISSSSMSFLGIWAPSELNYYVWGAVGNATTCTIQGFVYILGTCMSTFYSCSLNFYYLAIVKYEKSDEYIRKKIEPFLHGISIVITLIIVITRLINGNYNDHGGGACVSPIYSPPHCVGYADGEIRDGFTIPCGRGRGLLFFIIAFILTSVCPPLVIGGSLFSIYRSVLRVEKKVSKYGVKSLRSNLNLAYMPNVSAQIPSHEAITNESLPEKKTVCSFLSQRVEIIAKRFSKNTQPSRSRLSSKSRSKSAKSKSRAVMHKAIAYSISYFLTWTFLAVFVFQEFVAKKEVSVAIRYLAAIFVPLQGVYNLIIFMFPNVSAIKNKSKNEKITWRQAIVKAFWSRGPARSQRSSVKSRGSAISKRRDNNSLLSSQNRPNNRSAGIQMARIKHEEEEEKTETVPSHLIQNGENNVNFAIHEQNLVTNLEGSVVKKNRALEAFADFDAEEGTKIDIVPSVATKYAGTAPVTEQGL